MEDIRPIVRLLQQYQWISVSELGQRLGCQRREVEEGIKILKQRGTGVEYDAARGYRLTDSITMIDENRLIEFLRQAAPVTATRLMVLDTVESTNNQLLQWIDVDTLHGRVCVAEHQSRGRGRYGRSWLAAPYCNIALSLAWKTRRELAELSVVSLVAGLAVARTIERASLVKVQLKWPNDLVFHHGKLGGVLVDVKASSYSGSDIVIGVGVNLYNPLVVSEQVDQVIVNLQDLVNAPIDRTQLIGELLVELSVTLAKLDERGFADDLAEWNRRDAYFGLQVTGQTGNRQIYGEGLGIDESGAYRVRDTAGHIYRLISGKVTMLRMQPFAPVEEIDWDGVVRCVPPVRIV